MKFNSGRFLLYTICLFVTVGVSLLIATLLGVPVRSAFVSSLGGGVVCTGVLIYMANKKQKEAQ
ncbi:hypothetical protein GCM10023149_47770 [Mucilaginibacter gynuensis]|uniref:Uncharacterized protein n=1 Tax=Mucilaginibacter gynuensis TaxID=1302236 RepID=A0ABP8HE33_9SPHI